MPETPPPLLRFPCRLGPDNRGIPSGAAYPRLARAGWDNQRGTAFTVVSSKSGRVLDAMNGLVKRCVYRALVDPSVLDIRDNYPAFDVDRIKAHYATEKGRIPTRLVPTLSLVLTQADPAAPQGVVYRALRVVPFESLTTSTTQQTIDTDQRFCDEQGWRWSLVTEREVPVGVARTARAISVIGDKLNLDGLRSQAEQVAPMVQRRADGRSLKSLSASIAKTLGTSPQDVINLIAAMAMHGFIKLDLGSTFDRRSPLVLVETTS